VQITREERALESRAALADLRREEQSFHSAHPTGIDPALLARELKAIAPDNDLSYRQRLLAMARQRLNGLLPSAKKEPAAVTAAGHGTGVLSFPLPYQLYNRQFINYEIIKNNLFLILK
jgi:hypothetical protein